MFKSIIEASIRDRIIDIYEKLAATSKGVADISDKLLQLIDHITENRRTINVLIEMQTQQFEAAIADEARSVRGGIPSLADLLSSPVDDDDMPN